LQHRYNQAFAEYCAAAAAAAAGEGAAGGAEGGGGGGGGTSTSAPAATFDISSVYRASTMVGLYTLIGVDP
jgi:hypothetical protein